MIEFVERREFGGWFADFLRKPITVIRILRVTKGNDECDKVPPLLIVQSRYFLLQHFNAHKSILPCGTPKTTPLLVALEKISRQSLKRCNLRRSPNQGASHFSAICLFWLVKA
jgi:hypothetical protein